MCMYNRLNGVYGAENKWLLTDVLRHDFGFEGMIVTDWGAENDRVLRSARRSEPRDAHLERRRQQKDI